MAYETDGQPPEHPHDQRCYEVFAEWMGWAADWWELGTDQDVPGPGRLPFVMAFRECRALSCGPAVPPSGVDHWGEWVRQRERQRADRAAQVQPGGKRTEGRKRIHPRTAPGVNSGDT